MNNKHLPILAIALGVFHAQAAVKLTAVQIVSTDSNGKIQGVGAHRFRTTLHGGHPAVFLIKGSDRNGEFINGPTLAKNGIDIPLSAGTHTYTIYVEKNNTYLWTNYSMQFFFDLSNSPQISVMAPLNQTSQLFNPPFEMNKENTEDLNGRSVKSPASLLYKNGRTEVVLTGFHLLQPEIAQKDRVSPFEVKVNRNLDYVGEFTLEVKAPPEIAAGGVVNGASFQPKVAPGTLFSVFGTSLATTTASASALPLASNIGGTVVTVGGRPAPLVFVSATQINAQVPYEVTEAQNVPVVVTVNGVASLEVNVNVIGNAPGIFQFGERRAVVQNEDYSVNTADNPAAVDSFVVAYLTGAGRLDNNVASGAPAGVEPISRPRVPVTATIGDMPASIAFGGLTPNFVGLMQVNMKVPPMPPGTYPLVVTVGGEKSNTAFITVR
jgi:uncharacterized protein (TIGR03437 family)